MITYGKDEILLPWAAERIGIERFREDARAIGVMSGAEIRGVVVYDTFSACDCSIHAASDGTGRWLSREALIHFFAYPFIQLKLRRLTSIVAAKNVHSASFTQKCGFTQEGYCKNAMPDDDIIIFGLLREHCRYIPQEHRHA